MCGVLGVVREVVREGDVEAVRRGLGSLLHRGPDASSVRMLRNHGGECVLGATRLRIIDLSPEADQPLANEDETVWVAYNGELYNAGELRADLVRAGHHFRSRSDTEVLVHLYETVDGDIRAMLGRLRGMFAFALFDTHRARMVLARDRLGIKPLYIAEVGTNGTAFASEVRALVAAGFASSAVSDTAISAYLSWGVVPAPHTIFSGARELPPGHFLDWRAGTQQIERWWAPAPDRDPELGNDEEATRVMAAVLEDAVARHLVADRPVGVFLSGGLDSGAVTALAARSSASVRALTVTFPDVPDRGEATAAALAAAASGAEHAEVPVTGADVAESLPQALRAMDQPTWDAVNTWLVSRAAKARGLVVCLSGLGGDELFGGYPTFRLVPRLARFRNTLTLVPARLRRASARAASRAWPGGRLTRAVDANGGLRGAYEAVRGLFSPFEVSELLSARATSRTQLAGSGGADSVGFLEMTHYLPNQLLRDTDSASMAHSLEIRVPLLDDVVVRMALAVPPSVRLARDKQLLARAAGVEPRMPKRPFSLPFEVWLRGPLREPVRQGLLSDELPFAQLLAGAARRRLWHAFVDGRTHWSRPWAVAVLRLWPSANGLSA